MRLLRFTAYLLGKLIYPVLGVCAIPFLIVLLVVMYPVIWVWHYWEVFNERRPAYLDPTDLMTRRQTDVFKESRS